MPVPNPFTPDLFSTTALTAAINRQPYAPGRLAQLGLFAENGVSVLDVFLEFKNGELSLVQTAPRGASGSVTAADRRNGVSVRIPHIPTRGSLKADEVQGVRAFGSENALQSPEQKRDEVLAKMGRRLDLTLEYHRLGAIRGIILDADGSTLYNLYSLLGVAEPAAVTFNLSNATFDVRAACATVTRTIMSALQEEPMTGVHALCGDAFFDALVTHPRVEDTYRYQEGEANRRGLPYRTLDFGGVTFENYRGFGSVAINTDQARFFPLGVADLFQTWFGPADYLETVNTLGLPKYAKAEMAQFEKGIEMEAQSNPLNVCTRPNVLIRGNRT